MTRSLAARGPGAPPRFVPIADLAKRLGVTSRTLRHYQDLGLIRSHRIARNVRAYDLDTVATLETIVTLRDADLRITTIREILALRDDPAAQRTATCHALTAALTDKLRQVAHIEALIASCDCAGDPPTPASSWGPGEDR